MTLCYCFYNFICNLYVTNNIINSNKNNKMASVNKNLNHSISKMVMDSYKLFLFKCFYKLFTIAEIIILIIKIEFESK